MKSIIKKIFLVSTFLLLIGTSLVSANETTNMSLEENEKTVRESYEKLDSLVLEYRKQYGDDWEKIDKKLESKGFKLVKAKVKNKKEKNKDEVFTTQDLTDSDVATSIRVYKDMNSSFFHVRGYWDWTSSHYAVHTLTPDDAAGIGVSSEMIGSVRNGSYVATLYNSSYTKTFPNNVIIEQADGSGMMAISINDTVTVDGFTAHHGVYGYSIDNPGKTLAFESGYIHAWTAGELQSVTASYPLGVSATYSWSTNYQRESSTSLTIKDYEWSSLTTSGKKVSN